MKKLQILISTLVFISSNLNAQQVVRLSKLESCSQHVSSMADQLTALSPKNPRSLFAGVSPLIIYAPVVGAAGAVGAKAAGKVAGAKYTAGVKAEQARHSQRALAFGKSQSDILQKNLSLTQELEVLRRTGIETTAKSEQKVRAAAAIVNGKRGSASYSYSTNFNRIERLELARALSTGNLTSSKQIEAFLESSRNNLGEPRHDRRGLRNMYLAKMALDPHPSTRSLNNALAAELAHHNKFKTWKTANAPALAELEKAGITIDDSNGLKKQTYESKGANRKQVRNRSAAAKALGGASAGVAGLFATEFLLRQSNKVASMCEGVSKKQAERLINASVGIDANISNGCFLSPRTIRELASDSDFAKSACRAFPGFAKLISSIYSKQMSKTLKQNKWTIDSPPACDDSGYKYNVKSESGVTYEFVSKKAKGNSYEVDVKIVADVTKGKKRFTLRPNKQGKQEASYTIAYDPDKAIEDRFAQSISKVKNIDTGTNVSTYHTNQYLDLYENTGGEMVYMDGSPANAGVVVGESLSMIARLSPVLVSSCVQNNPATPRKGNGTGIN